MVNRSKNKGTAAETALVRAAQACGLSAERIALSGGDDSGDVLISTPDPRGPLLVVQVKAEASYTARTKPVTWVAEAEGQALAYQRSRQLQATPSTALVCKPTAVGSSTEAVLRWHTWIVLELPTWPAGERAPTLAMVHVADLFKLLGAPYPIDPVAPAVPPAG